MRQHSSNYCKFVMFVEADLQGAGSLASDFHTKIGRFLQILAKMIFCGK